MAFQYQKAKSAAKQVTPRGATLDALVLRTMQLVSDIVGGTLGPSGRAVLIERQEFGLPPVVTKDGVTVFRSLGFEDPAAHCIMEAARDAAVRTAAEAGDGTSCTTVLSEAIVRHAAAFTRRYPRQSPQKVVRRLERAFAEVIEPCIEGMSTRPDSSTDEGWKMLLGVAAVSANGDTDLAEKVLECFEVVGDDGSVTIAEVSGPSSYEVEQIQGFPIGMGYEESAGKFASKFVNDAANQRTFLEDPVFILYHGRINEIQSILGLMHSIGSLWEKTNEAGDGYVEQEGQGIWVKGWNRRHNVVIVATGFSESVIAQLAANMAEPETLNVFPLLCPQSPIPNAQQKFLEDLAAITGAKVLDQLNAPISRAGVADLGWGEGLQHFEATRFRSTVVGYVDDTAVLARATELRANLATAASDLDRDILQERLGKLTGGIARLKVIGASNGELKEKRDRAEDAVCAVRGAIKHGCLPAGGWTLLALCSHLKQEADPIISEVLIPSLFEPVARLFKNAGYTPEETQAALEPVLASLGGTPVVYDLMEAKHVDPFESGLLDSTPAVLEAIRNALSIASLLGTLGGTVVFARDAALERSEASANEGFLRDANVNEANLRP